MKLRRWVVVVAGVAGVGADVVAVKVVVLTQRRVQGLERLLRSLATSDIPGDAVVDLHIAIDHHDPQETWSARLRARRDQEALEGVARRFVARWTHGNASVATATKRRGLRGQWLAIHQPPQRRLLVVEDDVVLSPVWFEFLQGAIGYDAAGVSLQRQRHRLDEARAGKLAVADGLYLFPHVGSWAFSPAPGVWRDFRRWFFRLRDPDAPTAWSAAGGVVARWYAESIRASRGDAVGPHARPDNMWTAHFDAYCATRGLAVLHAAVRGNTQTFATSYRTDGAHYVGINKPDARLVDRAAWEAEVRDALFVVPSDRRRPLVAVGLDGSSSSSSSSRRRRAPVG